MQDLDPRALAAAVILVPLAAGLIVLILPEMVVARLRELVAVVAAAITAVFAGMLCAGLSGGVQSLPLFRLPRIRLPGVGVLQGMNLGVYLDHLSMLALLAVTALTLLVIVYAWSGVRRGGRRGEFFAYALWALGGANLALLSDNLFMLLVGWEIASVMLFYLVTIGGDRARHSAGKTMVMLGAADCALLLGLVMVVAIKEDLAGMSLSRLAAGGAVALRGGGVLATVAFLMIVLGALTKAGAMPLHSWIPKAAEGAPAATMALLPAAIDKLLGVYLLARACLVIFDWTGPLGLRILLMLVGAVTVVLAVLAALVQRDLRKLLALMSISAIGYAVMGLASGTATGVAGAAFHALNCALYSAVLFMCAGAIEKRAGTTELEKLGGLGRRMPFTFASMFMASMAISGVPLFNGFVSKWMIYGGVLEAAFAPPASAYANLFTAAAAFSLVASMFGSALTLACLVKVLHAAFMGPAPRECAAAQPAPFSMWLPMTVISSACLVLGVVPHGVVNQFLGPIAAESGLGAGLAGSGLSLAPGSGNFWSPLLAAVLVLVSLVAGGAYYLLAGTGRARVVRPFVSGETGMFSPEELRIPGTGFYNTVMELGAASTIYRDAAEGAYDPYELVGTYGSRLVEVGRRLHNGVLPTYLGFCMLGLLVVLAALLLPLMGLW
jgi:formate hydrogenlyase subunit 3/multisubunit Na+/H+ antiporter MnhD subunit